MEVTAKLSLSGLMGSNLYKKEKVAVVDGGGRGSVLVRAYAKSPHVGEVLAFPGNDMMGFGTGKPVRTFPGIKTTDVEKIVRICMDENVALVDVAQDNAIEVGLVNSLRHAGIKALGPTKGAGQIEWDKEFAREFGTVHGSPQPWYRVFKSEQEGIDFVKRHFAKDGAPVFVKAAGLAEGKGAIPAKNVEDAINAIKEMREFGNAGDTFLVEDWLRNEDGSNAEEFSAFAISDGIGVKILGYAQDHKRLYNFDEGPNTGGMGCSSPPLVLDAVLQGRIVNIISSAVDGLASKNRPYTGIIYLGGILQYKNNELNPSIIEWNARWGDPEAQVIVPGFKTDMLEVGMSAINNRGVLPVRTDGLSRIVVAGVSRGYPDKEKYKAVKGKQIFGLDEAMRTDGVEVYGAGVSVQDGRYYANGGRLFYIVGSGNDAVQARARAYEAIARVSIEGNNLHFRNDIGWRDVARLRREEL